MKTVPSENLLKLRELSDKICHSSDEYREIVKKLKKIIDDGKTRIDENYCDKDKVACYENMCLSIMGLLKNVKL